MRTIIIAAALVLPAACMAPALAQSAECTLVLPGAASEYGIVTGGGRTYIRRNDNPTALTRLADGASICFRAVSWRVEGATILPNFTFPGGPPTNDNAAYLRGWNEGIAWGATAVASGRR